MRRPERQQAPLIVQWREINRLDFRRGFVFFFNTLNPDKNTTLLQCMGFLELKVGLTTVQSTEFKT